MFKFGEYFLYPLLFKEAYDVNFNLFYLEKIL